MYKIVLAVVCLVGSTSIANAQQARHSRSVDLRIKVKRSGKLGRLVPKRPPAGYSPSLSADQVLGVMRASGSIRIKQMRALRELITLTSPDHSDLPDLIFRLAEMYLQQSRYWHMRAMEVSSVRN